MQPNEMVLKTWRRGEEARRVAKERPGLYRVRLWLLLLSGLAVSLAFFGLIVLFALFPAESVLHWPAVLVLGLLGVRILRSMFPEDSGILFFGAALLIAFMLLLLLMFLPDSPVLHWAAAGALGLFAAENILYLLFRDESTGGMLLDPKRHGPLYDDVRAICRELGVRPVKKIYLGVTTDPDFMSEVRIPVYPGRRKLGLHYHHVCALDAGSLRVCVAYRLYQDGSRFYRRSLLAWVLRVWSLPPWASLLFLNLLPPLAKSLAKRLSCLLTPLRVRLAEDAAEWCRVRFGADAFAAAMAQTSLPRFEPPVRPPQGIFGPLFVMQGAESPLFVKLAQVGEDGDPAGVFRDEVRKAIPDARKKLLLDWLLREIEPPDEPPPFRELVGTDDAAELLPYLDRAPDAAERYLLSSPNFEADFSRWMNLVLWLEPDRVRKKFDIMRELEAVDEDAVYDPYASPLCGADARNAWEWALYSAKQLGHADRYRELLENATRRFPKCRALRALELVRRMETATTAQEETEAAAALERLAEQSPTVAAEFRDELLALALRRGDAEEVRRRLAVRDAEEKQRRRRTKAPLAPDDILEPMKLTMTMLDGLTGDVSEKHRAVKSIRPVVRYDDADSFRGTAYFFVTMKSAFSRMLHETSKMQFAKFLHYWYGDGFTVRFAADRDLKNLEEKRIPAIGKKS